jgi:hypothetical protein
MDEMLPEVAVTLTVAIQLYVVLEPPCSDVDAPHGDE